jgi:beta-lactam-binding protein with PASTA domain
MKRIFNLILGTLAMLVVALTSAFISMRLAIHGREVNVPNLAGLTIADASKQASSLGLNISLENRFYSSTTPPGHVLAQSPAPGSTVRRDWAVRITESLGPQQVAIPNVLGQTERTASINVRRLGLELGVIAHLPSPGEPGIVLAQTPSPNAAGAESPRVSLLISIPEEVEAPAAPAAPTAAAGFVMPSLAGLTVPAASARVAPIGMRLVEDVNAFTIPGPGTPRPAAPPVATIVAQTPAAGHHVFKGQAVHITLTN